MAKARGRDLPDPPAVLPDWLTNLGKAHATIGPACTVRLFDITRGLPQRIEGQFRRHWCFVRAFWNLYFSERVNLGISLSVKNRQLSLGNDEVKEQDAAMAARDLLEKLDHGYWETHDQKKRKINGDFSKRLLSPNLTAMQRKILHDYQFRCKAIPGTQEIRLKIGNLLFWATVVYGNALFITVSSSTRHGYLAIRLSRYRLKDPFMDGDDEESCLHRHWAGKDAPSLEPDPDDEYSVDIPGCDLRQLLLARDPLAAVNAFFVQLRVVLATALGMRMCPFCPHCHDNPCQDAQGSVAELLGGALGRCDAMIGAVECQKTTGSLHFHAMTFLQCLHQFGSMQDIATAIEKQLATTTELKAFLAEIQVTSYHNLDQFKAERDELERVFPAYREPACSNGHPKWGDISLGRLPTFIYDDAQRAAATVRLPAMSAARADATSYADKFCQAFQYYQSRCQHHIHKKVNGKRPIPTACKSTQTSNQCKHDAPWTKLLSPKWMKTSLLICKGLAKEFELRCSGNRNWLGQNLPLRNEA